MPELHIHPAFLEHSLFYPHVDTQKIGQVSHTLKVLVSFYLQKKTTN